MDRFLLECSPANSLATTLLDAELIERSTWLKSTRKRIVARFPLTVLALLWKEIFPKPSDGTKRENFSSSRSTTSLPSEAFRASAILNPKSTIRRTRTKEALVISTAENCWFMYASTCLSNVIAFSWRILAFSKENVVIFTSLAAFLNKRNSGNKLLFRTSNRNLSSFREFSHSLLVEMHWGSNTFVSHPVCLQQL